MRYHYRQRKPRGMVLVITLLMMFVLTSLVVLSTGNVTLSEKIAHNYQLTTAAFRAAESAVEETIDLIDTTNVNYNNGADPVVIVMSGGNYSVNYDNSDG
ncbi:MAG: hypothetical protein HQL48_05090, partial [Gammaproteobacteria bacterium]|nr:hypothetical protein [Gammaproteobacteria bacterium]